ncbi:MAG: cytochrome C [Rhodospirillales bacterium]|nr:cytochrome C [Rhodospirillales bacterium]
MLLTAPIAVAVAAAYVAGDAAGIPAAAEEVTAAAVTSSDSVSRGRYMVVIGGCNDCHTSGYLFSNGDVPEAAWLTGDTMGFRGPWGTTYATNLRLLIQDLGEDEWVAMARNLVARPPMPWFNLRQMQEQDLRDIYRYVRHLGGAGKPAPAAVDPDEEPTTAYILMQPQPPVGRGR